MIGGNNLVAKPLKSSFSWVSVLFSFSLDLGACTHAADGAAPAINMTSIYRKRTITKRVDANFPISLSKTR